VYNNIRLEPKHTAWSYALVIWNLGKWNSVKWNETRRIGAIFASLCVARVCQRQLGFLVYIVLWSHKRTPRCIVYCRLRSSQAGPLRPQSGNFPRLGRLHENWHLEDRLQLFRCIASNQEYTAFSEQTSTAIASHVLDPVSVGLWQRHSSGRP